MSEHVPEGWESTMLGELGELSTSSVDKKLSPSEIPVRLINYMDVYRNCYLDSSMNLMSVTATRAEVEKSQLRSGDILFTPSSETPDDIGHSAVLVDEAPGTLHSYHTVRLRIHPSRNVDNRFRGRLANAKSVLKHFSISATGSTRYTLSLGDFRSAPVNLPPIEEQAKIARVLDAIDTAIAETEAIIAKLKAVKLGLLHDLLTRGIDANGELRPLQSEAPQLYRQSALGPIPKEWDVSGLSSVAPQSRSVIRTGPFGSSLKGKHWREDGTPVVTIGSLGDGEFIASELLYVDDQTAKRLVEFSLIPGDLAFSRVADVGRSVVISEDQRGWIMSSNFMRISCDAEKVRPHFLQALLSSSFLVRMQLRTTVNSAGRDVANSAVLLGLLFPWPEPPEQDAILKRLESFDERMEEELRTLNKLMATRTGLMDDLLTGKVRVTALVG